MKKDTYFLIVGQEEEYRLELLNDIYNPSSQQFLINSGLKQGMSVMDVGCGTGLMSSWIADYVGKDGNVIGVDLNEEQIKIAKKNAQTRSNVDFITHSVYELDELDEEYDFIYSRYLLEHVEDPVAVIKQLRSRLKPGGILVCETVIFSSCFSEPSSKAFDDSMIIFKTAFSKQGKDYDRGKKLVGFMKDAELDVINANSVQPLLVDKKQQYFFPLCLHSLKPFLLEEKIMTEREIDEVIKALENDIENSNAVWGSVQIVQVAGMI